MSDFLNVLHFYFIFIIVCQYIKMRKNGLIPNQGHVAPSNAEYKFFGCIYFRRRKL